MILAVLRVRLLRADDLGTARQELGNLVFGDGRDGFGKHLPRRLAHPLQFGAGFMVAERDELLPAAQYFDLARKC
jgi:hypothetical protein